MTTSGTVATTVVSTATLIEHAFRRCKLPAAGQTAEAVQAAQESLYMLALSLANRGLNLWAVEKQIIGTVAGQADYVSNPGTIDILNVIYSTPTRVTGTDGNDAFSYTTTLASATNVVRIGVKFSAVTASSTLTLSGSTDGVTYTTLLTKTKTDWATGTWYWFDVPKVFAYTYYKANFGANAATFSEFYLASTIADIPLTTWNRDTYMAINDKNKQAHPTTNYFYEKKLTPQFTAWPVPDTDYNQFSLFCHRQIQDVGTLVQQLEIPQRWVEAFTWQCALRVGFEHPQVDDARIGLLKNMCDQHLIEAEGNESDGLPIFLAPNISVYSR